jgi:FUS-interacting serine-arginine-rich protein 1
MGTCRNNTLLFTTLGYGRRDDFPGPPPARRGERRRRDEGPPGVSLLVRNVHGDINTADLQQAFSRIGEVRDVYIPRDYHSQQPKGFAFIEYATPEMAREAREEMDRFSIKGRQLEVVFAQERRKTPNEMRGRAGEPPMRRGRDFERYVLPPQFFLLITAECNFFESSTHFASYDIFSDHHLSRDTDNVNVKKAEGREGIERAFATMNPGRITPLRAKEAAKAEFTR